MAKTGPVTSEERLEIVEALKRGNLSHREIARRFDRAQSTVSAIAKDAAITPTNRRKRTPAATAVEDTYSRRRRPPSNKRWKLGVWMISSLKRRRKTTRSG
jgi:IS30 family transposase